MTSPPPPAADVMTSSRQSLLDNHVMQEQNNNSNNATARQQEQEEKERRETTAAVTSWNNEFELKYFVSEKSFVERLRYYLVVNQTISLRFRVLKFLIQFVSVLFYIIRASSSHDNPPKCCDDECFFYLSRRNQTWKNQYDFAWQPLLWVDRKSWIYIIQLSLAILNMGLEAMSTYVDYKGNLLQQLLTIKWFLQTISSLPLLIGIFWLRGQCLFVPIFLHIWLAKGGLESIVNDLHRAAKRQQSAMFNQVLLLVATLVCLITTCVCGVEHLERAGKNRIDLFDSFWFVVVTFSTVGYGDLTPTIWPSRLLVIVIISIALGIIPMQLEEMSFIWSERQRQGGEYSRRRARLEKHVVVCASELRVDVIQDFLNEFYAHAVLQRYYVVLAAPCELDGPLKSFLQIPIWSERVIFIQGSVLRETDLLRVKMDVAEACFILTSRQELDRRAADEKTILRAMAVKDYAPECPLYVQVLRPESRLHLRFADQVICDEEMKFVLLAMNSYMPGLSTMITLLAHTSKGREGMELKTKWKREFGKSAGNEIYCVSVNESQFFGEYVGAKFSKAAVSAHAKYGATMFAMERFGEIKLNPGNEVTIDNDDKIFYICLTEEENAEIIATRRRHSPTPLSNGPTEEQNQKRNDVIERDGSSTTEEKKLSRIMEDNNLMTSSERTNEQNNKKKNTTTTNEQNKKKNNSNKYGEEDGAFSTTMGSTDIGFPPVLPYVGHNSPTMCHLLRERARICCMRIDRPCEHCASMSAFDYDWPQPPIIICVEFASQSLFNIILPLRAHHRPRDSLHPVVFLMEHTPESIFLNAISCFPMIYYMLGAISGLNSFLRAGVTRACHVIIVDRDTSVHAEEEHMADSKQLVATQTMFELFPHIPVCLELTYATNMRFMHFLPPLSDFAEMKEERRIEKACSVPYLFRSAFASGKVFSSGMLDTLLYQSFIKDYLPTLLRIMIGLQYTAGSGHLDKYKISDDDDGKSYHEMFNELSSKYGFIILGIYRRVERESTTTTGNHPQSSRDSKKRRNSTLSIFKRAASFPTNVSSPSECDETENASFKKRSSKKHKRLPSRRRENLRHLHQVHSRKTDREMLQEMIKTRMRELDLSNANDWSYVSSDVHDDRPGYVMLNPPPDVALRKSDMLYVIVPEVKLPSCLSEHAEVGVEKVVEIHKLQTSQSQSRNKQETAILVDDVTTNDVTTNDVTPHHMNQV